MLREYITAVVQRLHRADSGEGTCRQRLTRVAHVFAQIVLESHDVILTLVRDLDQFDQEYTQCLFPYARQVPSVFAAIVEDGMASGEIRTEDAYRVGVVIMGMINSLAGHHLGADIEATLEDDIDLVITVLFEGIGV